MKSHQLMYRWIVSGLLLLLMPSMAPAQLSLNAEFRPRTEFRNGYRQLGITGSDPALFTSQRTRLSLFYESDLYSIGLTGQDVRVWGDVAQLQDNANVNIHEAWAQLKLSESARVKLGRQELVYGDHRLLGNVNWTQQARSHDAFVVKYRHPSIDMRIEWGGAYNQESERLLGNEYTLPNYKVLSYLWIEKQWEALSVSALALTDGFERPAGGTAFRYTYGTQLVYGGDGWALNGTVYLQNGDDTANSEISSSMYALKALYNYNSLQLSAGYDRLSGGEADDTNPRRYTFNTLYATNHKFYGHMDYFLNIPADTRGGGLQDLYLQASYEFDDRTSADITYHYFALAGSVADPAQPGQVLEKGLGSELDLSAGWVVTPEIALKAGYSIMLPTETLERLQQVDARTVQHWGWIMLSLTPSLLD